ncbi:Folate-Biopterin Transporter (FBT) Family, partial [Phytophthora palmivora]
MATTHHGPGGPAKADLPGRLSFVSGTSQPKDIEDGNHYSEVKTPDPTGIEGGALREGGPPDLKSKDSLGLLVQYAAVGLIYGVNRLPAIFC